MTVGATRRKCKKISTKFLEFILQPLIFTTFYDIFLMCIIVSKSVLYEKPLQKRIEYFLAEKDLHKSDDYRKKGIKFYER